MLTNNHISRVLADRRVADLRREAATDRSDFATSRRRRRCPRLAQQIRPNLRPATSEER